MFISPRIILYYKRTTYQANHAYSRLVKGDGFWIVVVWSIVQLNGDSTIYLVALLCVLSLCLISANDCVAQIYVGYNPNVA